MAEAVRKVSVESAIPPDAVYERQKLGGVGNMPNGISQAEGPQYYTPSRPVLEKPKVDLKGQQLSMGAMLAHFVDSVESNRSAALKLDHHRLELASENMDQIETEKFQKLKEAAVEVQKKETWDFWKKIAFGLSIATSAVIGVALIAAGGTGLVLAGGALVLSSVGTAASMVLEAKGYNPQVTGSLALVSAALGIAGSCGTAFLDPTSTYRLIATISQSALSLAHGTTTFGSNYSQAQLDALTHQLELIKHKIGVEMIETDRLFLDSQIAVEKMDVTKKAQEALAEYQRGMLRITQGSLGAA